MNASSNELEDFEKNSSPEKFEINAPSNNKLLPSANASVSRPQGASVEIDWSQESDDILSSSSENVLTGIENSARKQANRFPRSSRAHANLGVALLKHGQPEDAMQELEISLQLDPRNYLASITLARLHFMQERFTESESLYERLVRDFPADSAAKVGLSNLLIRTDRYEKANAHLREAVLIDKFDPYIHFLLGLVCVRRADLRCALSEFRVASNLDGRNPNIYHAIGVTYALQGDHLRAEKAFKTALMLAPDSPATVMGLAHTLCGFKKTESAIEILNEYLASHSEDLEARELLANVLMQADRNTAARSQLRMIIETCGKDLPPIDLSRLHANVAVSFLRERSLMHAETELKIAISLSPHASHIPYANLARVYALTNRAKIGIVVLESVLERFDSNPEIRVLLAALYGEEEKYDEAISNLEVNRQRDLLTDEHYAMLGHFYGEAQSCDVAIQILMEGYARFPKSAKIINNLAYFLLEGGWTSQAKEVLSNRPADWDTYVALVATFGLLYLHEGNYDLGKSMYKRADSLAIKSSQKHLARRVRQKMHLELARFHKTRGENDLARREIAAGLREKVEKLSYKKQLESLEETLG
jgi:tetratricopeptide (TPR) repeat protein